MYYSRCCTASSSALTVAKDLFTELGSTKQTVCFQAETIAALRDLAFSPLDSGRAA